MGFVIAAVFLALAIGSVVVYGATPHGGPTTSCGPIAVFGNTYTIHADCRYVSVAELIAAGLLFFFAVVATLSTRPRT